MYKNVKPLFFYWQSKLYAEINVRGIKFGCIHKLYIFTLINFKNLLNY
jgi:hypothetical protein